MTVLFVDDDERVLAMFARTLASRFQVETRSDPAEALELVRKGSVAVAVADLRMPGMDGMEFLARAGELSPNTVKIVLTGHADLESAMAGVNEGRLFRFLTKPCDTQTLVRALEAALEQHRLVTAEKELLRGTLHGCIKVLTEILGQTNPEAFGRAERIKRLARAMAPRLRLKDPWKVELAAMLSQIGCIFIPEEIVQRGSCDGSLSPEELQIYHMHPTVGSQLLSSIPRLEDVREMIRHQEDSLADNPAQPRGARLLKICLDFDALESCLGSKVDAVGRLKQTPERYDPAILEAFERYVLADTGVVPRDIRLAELREGMILGEDLMSETGAMLLAKGLEVNPYSLMRLRNLAKAQKVREPFRVLVPMTGAASRQEDAAGEQAAG
ncbi:Hydrogenase transcriptional regulatory protein hupR1 [Fundidesulfovibrio magnetotacticus]|uniref:Hydrogenase transcriptional regulatory protein hupR1 n=1 Tax=Fundidesulfovibrio magnetotacticus TaxID=2730080 RepID=A0A6V8LZZ0_9BACT|nr:HD domain-containing phosphohydrolase [Fundidesulfovibrio magnetotacticus]GFK95187.1 Hydrogenase transcriptional regulatory protein hupR1 [Fundidesulfovibrio magnetotacticus]